MTATSRTGSDFLGSATFHVLRSLLLCEEISLNAPSDELAGPVHEHAKARYSVLGRRSLTDVRDNIAKLLNAAASGEAAYDREQCLYHELLDGLDLGINWGRAGPVLPAEAAGIWLTLLNDFDENVILCLDLIRRNPAAGLSSSIASGWQLHACFTDAQLNRLLKNKVTDLHVHLSGVRQAAVTWARVMATPGTWADFPRLAKEFEWQVGRKWEDSAEQARRDRSLLCRAGSMPSLDLRSLWRDPDPKAVVADERRLLINALRAMQNPCVPAGSPTPGAVRTSFWRYVRAKHHFQRATRQPVFDTSPGLGHFDEGPFRATKPRDKARYSGRPPRSLPAFRSSREFGLSEHKAAVRTLACDPILETVELRISPFDRAADYLAFLHGFEVIREKLSKSEKLPLPRIRFAVHLVRSERTSKERVRRIFRRSWDAKDWGSFWHAFHADVGRQTAVLHRVLIDPRHQELTQAISRIDVAGQERDTPIELFAPHLKLLTGDEEALDLLERLAERDCGGLPEGESSPAAASLMYAAEWRRMVPSGAHRRRRPNGIALTLHAGEDYCDPLEGLFQIWAAVETCGMRAGEGIGHALALGDSPETSGADGAMMSAFQNWASLLWLKSLLPIVDPHRRESAARTKLDELIIAADAGLRGSTADRRSPSEVFEALYRPKRGPAGVPKDNWTGPSAEKVESRPRAVLGPLVALAQRWLRQHLIDKKIVIEGNPSSNLRVSGAPELAQLPTAALLLQISSGLQFCINTDNPGTFAVSIRTEYALLLQATLERLRRTGAAAPDKAKVIDLLRQAAAIGRKQAAKA